MLIKYIKDSSSNLPPIDDVYRVILNINNIQDAVRKHCSYHTEVHDLHPDNVDDDSVEDEPQLPIDIDNINSLQEASDECGMVIWRLHGNRVSPTKDIISPQSHYHIHPFMIIYEDGDGGLQLLYPKQHRKSWDEYETNPRPHDYRNSNYRDAYDHRGFPNCYSGPEILSPTKVFYIKYGSGDEVEEGKPLKNCHFAGIYTVIISKTVRKQETIDKLVFRLKMYN